MKPAEQAKIQAELTAARDRQAAAPTAGKAGQEVTIAAVSTSLRAGSLKTP